MVCSDESDFFAHREEELEIWSLCHLCYCHHEGYTDTIISSERCSISFQYSIFLNDCHAFSIPIMWFSGYTDHVHVRLETYFCSVFGR